MYEMGGDFREIIFKISAQCFAFVNNSLRLAKSIINIILLILF